VLFRPCLARPGADGHDSPLMTHTYPNVLSMMSSKYLPQAHSHTRRLSSSSQAPGHNPFAPLRITLLRPWERFVFAPNLIEPFRNLVYLSPSLFTRLRTRSDSIDELFHTAATTCERDEAHRQQVA